MAGLIEIITNSAQLELELGLSLAISGNLDLMQDQLVTLLLSINSIDAGSKVKISSALYSLGIGKRRVELSPQYEGFP